MSGIWLHLKQIFHSKELRKRILFTLFIIALFRLFAHIPVPGANVENIRSLIEGNALLGSFSLLTGGGLEQFSIMLMGISPYITASIIIQLLTVIIPKLESLSKEGDSGRERINRYTRILTVPLAFLQAYGMIRLLDLRVTDETTRIIADTSWSNMIFIMLIITGGSMVAMWLGELISEKGIGNGISILIFANILAGIPQILGPVLDLSQADQAYLIPLIGIIAFTVILTIMIVLITEAQRLIPITHAGLQARGQAGSSHLPIRINQAGMIPIIFAVSFISFPTLIASFFQNARSEWLAEASKWLVNSFNPNNTIYLVVYFLLVVAFTFFYVSITFNSDQVAENLQKRGSYIPGIRPGSETSTYLRSVSQRVTLLGSLFLGFVAVMPMFAQFLGSQLQTSVPLLISGAGLIIIVGVVLEIIRQINAQLVMQDYEKLY
ncbi:MAG: preprotein translocase subunit SecY [Candidatus Abawacabacteria bacterium RBG_16_42_10]|uniref:Protein translocase subunit SecY n=1 Tax=Candidatus Abawacabacteria bacterium RBG_16_42_10 TaxID=1817814 RepID=A0A1F4XJY0_9BACT|nr:MAG: preprotein translocase subunit SecY [Candidatus Abawacabacteria bacterium RBG_16_42_10]